ncbi:hypothetical protein C8R46DRAFT_905421 [Mycena filopes]|nr:hypothetical protein C8R46DRAFT_905421 [Mycena filopes]
MLASSGTQATIAYFLRLVRARSPDTIPRNIMTDFDWAQINAILQEWWEAIVLLLLCWWHVLHAWQKHLHIDTYPEVWDLLKKWIRITDAAEFEATWLKIQSLAPTAFVKYLKDYWMAPHVVKMWSAMHRTNRTIFQLCDTNMLIEAWHHVLKGKFLHGKRNRRLDHLLSTLLADVLPYYALKQRRQALGFEGVDIEVKKRKDIIERSKVYVKDDIVHVEGGKYLVSSKSDPSKAYEVDLETYTCQCLDYPLISYCKHLCAVQELFGGDGDCQDDPQSIPSVPVISPLNELRVDTPVPITIAADHPKSKIVVAEKMERLAARLRQSSQLEPPPLDELEAALDSMLIATEGRSVLPAITQFAPVVKPPTARATMMPGVKTKRARPGDKAYGGGAKSGSLANKKSKPPPVVVPSVPTVAASTSAPPLVHPQYPQYQPYPPQVYYPMPGAPGAVAMNYPMPLLYHNYYMPAPR